MSYFGPEIPKHSAISYKLSICNRHFFKIQSDLKCFHAKLII